MSSPFQHAPQPSVVHPGDAIALAHTESAIPGLPLRLPGAAPDRAPWTRTHDPNFWRAAPAPGTRQRRPEDSAISFFGAILGVSVSFLPLAAILLSLWHTYTLMVAMYGENQTLNFLEFIRAWFTL